MKLLVLDYINHQYLVKAILTEMGIPAVERVWAHLSDLSIDHKEDDYYEENGVFATVHFTGISGRKSSREEDGLGCVERTVTVWEDEPWLQDEHPMGEPRISTYITEGNIYIEYSPTGYSYHHDPVLVRLAAFAVAMPDRVQLVG